MFAYCQNNPILYVDPLGAMVCCTFLGDSHILSDGYLMGGNGSCGITASKSASDRVIANELAFFNNTSEAAVLEAETFAFYKGVLVVKVPSMEKSGLSVGVIFLGSDVSSPNTVRHEYGHTRQLSQLGFGDYLVLVGIPSLYYYNETSSGKYTWDQYYDRPWELLADSFGQVDRVYSTDALNAAEIYWFFAQLLSMIT